MFKPDVRHEDAADTLFDQLETWARDISTERVQATATTNASESPIH